MHVLVSMSNKISCQYCIAHAKHSVSRISGFWALGLDHVSERPTVILGISIYWQYKQWITELEYNAYHMLISTNRRIIIQYGIMMKGGYSLHRTSLSSINFITLPWVLTVCSDVLLWCYLKGHYRVLPNLVGMSIYWYLSACCFYPNPFWQPIHVEAMMDTCS